MPKPEGSSTQQNVAMILAVFVEAANFFFEVSFGR